MKSVIRGKTASVITLNKTGITIRGKEDALVDIDTSEKRNEVMGLANAGFIEIISSNDFSDEVMSKGKSEEQRIKEAQDKTEQDGGRVVIGTGNGTYESKMVKNAIDRFLDDDESDRTKASIDALKKMELEEAGKDAEETVVDESKLPPQEQMGRQATVSTGDKETKEDMVNSVLTTNKDRDPFIDREVKVEVKPEVKAPAAKKRGRPKKIITPKEELSQIEKSKIETTKEEKPKDKDEDIFIDTTSKDNKKDGEWSDSFIEI
jgi:hypothetical protein